MLCQNSTTGLLKAMVCIILLWNDTYSPLLIYKFLESLFITYERIISVVKLKYKSVPNYVNILKTIYVLMQCTWNIQYPICYLFKK